MTRRLGFSMTLAMTLLAACGGEEAAAPPPAAPPPPPPVEPAPPPTASAPPVETPAPKPALADLEKKSVTDWYAAFNGHDAKKLASLFASDGVLAAPGPGGIHEKTGKDEVEKSFAPLFVAFPDIKAVPSRILQKKDVVVVEWVATGTNSGEMMGMAATNKKTGIWGADVMWFNDDGSIKRDESYHDEATIMQQIGKMPGKARELATLPTSDASWVVATGTEDEDKLVEQMKATWPATWSKRDAKAYAAVVTDDGQHIEVASPNDYKGKAALVKELEMYSKAIPDMNAAVDSAWGFAPNLVVAKFTVSGTMKGNLGPLKATNKPVTIHGLDVDEIKDGKMAKGTTYSNGTELLAALNMLPKPPAPKGDAKAAPAKGDAKADTKAPAKTDTKPAPKK